jgi:dolichol-phosphate mannosyltransferase
MQTRPSPSSERGASVTDPKLGYGAWIVLPTYDEADNIGPVSEAILASLPGATLLVVDDNSPDGTGRLADDLAAVDKRIRVHHRPGKQGLGRAYLDGFRVALDGGASVIVQMDADFSHDPSVLPALIAPIVDNQADLVIGSRYVKGGGTVDWGLVRRVISRGGSIFARTLLRLEPHDLTGGFKGWPRPSPRSRSTASTRVGTFSRSRRRSGRADRARVSARFRSFSPTGGSGRARCHAGSWSRRC